MSFSVISDPRNDRVFLKFETLSSDILYELDKAFYEMGKRYYDYLYPKLNFGQRTGKRYMHTNPFSGKRYSRISSAPGEFPQKQTGALQRGLAFNANGRRLSFGIQNPNSKNEDTEYAKYLEEGTKKMRPRLLIKYTVKQNEQDALKMLRERLDTAIKSIG